MSIALRNASKLFRFYNASLDIVFLILILPFLLSVDCSRIQLQDDDDFPEEEFPL